MSALPAVYRLDNVYQGMMQPDYEAVLRALPSDFATGMPERIMPMHELGDVILGVSETLPGIGKQGVFGYIYGTLQHRLGDILDGSPDAQHLPRIDNADDLTRQANKFAYSWLRPVGMCALQAMAGQRGDFKLQKELAKEIGPQWLYSFESPEVQFGEPTTQFASGGMFPHIITDLGNDLVISRVSRDYMRRGGDYDKVNYVIRDVTTEKATELIEGNKGVVEAAVQPVATAISGLRWVARQTYNRLDRAESQEEYDAIQARAEVRAVTVSRLATHCGDTAIRSFSRFAGAKHAVQQLGDDIDFRNAA